MPVGVVVVLEKCRPTQLLPGDPSAIHLCLKAKPFKHVLSLLGMEKQVKELGEKKIEKIESKRFWRRTSVKHLCKGHSDTPFQSVIPQDFNSAEWASLRRPSLSSL